MASVGVNSKNGKSLITIQVPTNMLGPLLVAIGTALQGAKAQSIPRSQTRSASRRNRRKTKKDQQRNTGKTPVDSVPASIPLHDKESEGEALQLPTSLVERPKQERSMKKKNLPVVSGSAKPSTKVASPEVATTSSRKAEGTPTRVVAKEPSCARQKTAQRVVIDNQSNARPGVSVPEVVIDYESLILAGGHAPGVPLSMVQKYASDRPQVYTKETKVQASKWDIPEWRSDHYADPAHCILIGTPEWNRKQNLAVAAEAVLLARKAHSQQPKGPSKTG